MYIHIYGDVKPNPSSKRTSSKTDKVVGLCN